MQLQEILLDQIDLHDHFFLITYPLDPGALIPSIEKVGLLQPVLLRIRPTGRYQIISGFKRVLACRELNLETVKAFVSDPKNLEDLEGFRYNLWDNLSIRTFNLIEKSVILHKLLNQFQLEKQRVINNYMPLLDLESNSKILEGYLYIYRLEEEIKSYLLTKEIPLKLVLKLSYFSPEDQKQLLSLALSLELNANIFREFIDVIEEVTKRDEIQVENLLDDSEIPDILTQSALSVSQKTEKVRKILKRKRYPQLLALEDQLQEKLKQLKLPREISLIPPPFFEGDRLKVMFQFRDKKELGEILVKLKELADKMELDDILKLISN